MSPSPTVSSIYSRSIGSPRLDIQLVHNGTSSSVSSEPDCPQITSADHKVGDARGFSTALESTGSRLQIAKRSKPQSDCEYQKILADDLTGIQWENEFYGECTEIYEELVLATVKASQNLSSQSQSRLLDYYFELSTCPPEHDFILQAVRDLKLSLEESQSREIAAVDKWVKHWDPKPGERISTAWI
ncbi:hypothetical protein N7537_011391 [Penicillium hordei]|uniref:Uncharacterized protein n=1 Tax=Penicillium hordei TaxID=40994 RepID=A0AAD6DLQ1_9EURO|nr:uncharacterized protein N7537_011391 [Penicillium hordei]KAJ5588713.1 hypothetical protein N7537_011391 [Penicillium hordei]